MNSHPFHPKGWRALLMHLLTMDPCSIAPIGDGSLIQAKGMHNGLHWTSIGQEGHHNHDEIPRFAQAFQHRSPTGTERFFVDTTAIALPLAIMDANIALSSLASCRTRRIRAKLVRRVHWLCCGVLHTHNMPKAVFFFKGFPLFHQLMGFCASRDAVFVSPTQLGRIWRNILGSSRLPEVERQRGQKHA